MKGQRMLAGLVLLAIAVPLNAMSTELAQPALVQDAPACDLCEGLVVSFASYMTDPKTQAYVRELLEQQLCEGLPDSFRDTCAEELGLVYNQILATIVAALDPADVCTALGLCAGPVAGLEGPFDCPMCRMVALTLIQRFKDPKVRQDMHTGFLEACNDLAPIKRPKCVTDVDELFRAFEDIMDDLDPDMACEVAQFCPRTVALGAGDAPALPAAFPAMAALFTRLASRPPTPLGDDASCSNCKIVNPKTQAEVIEYAKESCSMFPDWQDSCEQYVVLYGPLFINMLLSYLQPQAVCAELGYCPPLSLV